MANKYRAALDKVGSGLVMELGTWDTWEDAHAALEREGARRHHTIQDDGTTPDGFLYWAEEVRARKYPHKDKHLTPEQRVTQYVATAPYGVDTATVRAMYPRADLRRLDRESRLLYIAERWWTPARWNALTDLDVAAL